MYILEHTRLILLVSGKPCRENQNTHTLCSITLLENRAVYNKMWKNIVEPGRSQLTIWRMRTSCWIT